ncbi:MAG: hypothetical protein ACTHW2_10060 [Tissierella sp.]|uniref:hypothetical protein n=1 Tax=Tissierella sp. TaxID=41274 RepID=UPI003F995CB3
MKTMNSRKRYFHIICTILFIIMITISLGLKKTEEIEEKKIEKATFVKNSNKGEIYFE